MIDLHTAMPIRRTALTDHRSSYLLLRWLVIILASYLTVFSYVGNPSFNFVFTFALMFAATNMALAFVPLDSFDSRAMRIALPVTDVVFVSGTFYLLHA